MNIHRTADTDRETTKTSGWETRGPITCGNQWRKSSSDDDRRIKKKIQILRPELNDPNIKENG